MQLIFFVPGLYGTELWYKKQRGFGKKNVRYYPPSCFDFVLRRKKYGKEIDRHVVHQQSAQEHDLTTGENVVYYAGKVLQSYGGHSIYADFLKKLRAIPNSKVLTFGYDWRESLLLVVEELYNYVEVYAGSAEFQNCKILFVGHSLGGFIVRMLIERHPIFMDRYADRVATCAFCATPFFGQRHLFYRLCRAEFNNSVDGDSTLFSEHIFFSPRQMRDMLHSYRGNLVPLLRYDELPKPIEQHYGYISKCLKLPVEQISYYHRYYIEPLKTINKPNHIKYIIVYNLKYDKPTSEEHVPRDFGSDGVVTTRMVDQEQFNKLYNCIQIRLFTKIPHSLILNDKKLSRLICDKLDLQKENNQQ